jgi:hypothetical protein
MECNENFLREMLHSPYAKAIAEAICTRLDEGKTVTITNGCTVKLTNRAEALQTFERQFHWTPSHATGVDPQIS